MGRSRGLMVLVGLAVVMGLPLLGHWLRVAPADACALDGGKIDPLFRVRVVDDRGTSREFCCVTCATIWRERHHQAARTVFVTDELSGQLLTAESAYYVRSSVVTRATTGNRIHVFGSRADAERHAETCGGTLLHGPDRPFHEAE